jgi:hypothetical protein
VRISERHLRKIENTPASVAADLLDRMSRALAVPRDQLCKPKSLALEATPTERVRRQHFFPRFDTKRTRASRSLTLHQARQSAFYEIAPH